MTLSTQAAPTEKKRRPMRPGSEYINGAQVADLLGVSLATCYRWAHAGDFPRALRLGPNVVRWSRAEIIAWAQSRERGGDPTRAERLTAGRAASQ